LHTKNDSEKNRENSLSAYILRYLGIIIIIIIMAIIDIKVKYFTIIIEWVELIFAKNIAFQNFIVYLYMKYNNYR